MRKLATLATIESIHPHNNADSLELAKVRGWQICVKKGEFNPGDYCVYVEIDSVLPEWPEFEFMRDRKFRVKTIRLRGEISQGIVFPTEIIPFDAGSFEVGDDLTEVLGIELYAPPIPACLAGDVVGKFPSFVPKTDCERIQNHSWIVDELQDAKWMVTEKLDGCFERKAYLQIWGGGSTTMGKIVLHGERPALIGKDSDGNLVPCEITNVFKNGPKNNWVDIFFNPVHGAKHVGKSGRLRVTKNHKVFLSSGLEVFAGDVKVGDNLISCEEVPDDRILHYIKSSLLGDGSVCAKPGSNCKYAESHKESHRDFCDYIQSILGDCFSSSRKATSGYGTSMIQVTLKSYKEIERLRREWYPNGKKILPKDIDWIDDFSIAKLYMDDGSLSHSELQNDRASIAVNGFTKNDADRLASKIRDRYEVSVVTYENRGYQQIRINYAKGTIDNFWNAIAKHIHPDFKYKLPERYRDVSFSPYVSSKKNLMPVPVEVVGIKEIPVTKKNFPAGTIGFDLETTTHNYMCGGILVHNSSCTVYWDSGSLHVCSRNWELKESENNAYWIAARNFNLEDKLKGYPIVLQGELLGPKIQGNKYGLHHYKIFFFDAWNTLQNRYLNVYEFFSLCIALDLPTVPRFMEYHGLPCVDRLLDIAECKSSLNYGIEQEGLVFKPLTEMHDPRIGRVAFKAISNKFLLKSE